MSDFPSQKSVTNAILNGILKAEENFRLWTNQRLSLYYAPQKILTMYVAQELYNIKNPPEIFIDASTSDILRCSLQNRDDYVKFIKDRQLQDLPFTITLDERFTHENHNDSVSKVIISVRNSVINTKVEHIQRVEQICKMLYLDEKFSASSLEYGIFAFYSEISKNARIKLDKRMPQIIDKFDHILTQYPNLSSKFINLPICTKDDGEEWMIGCYIIEKSGS